MKTRAILQTSPFKTRDGEWVVQAVLSGRLTGPAVMVGCGPEYASFERGQTIKVERHGSEWRAV